MVVFFFFFFIFFAFLREFLESSDGPEGFWS